jgi:hypothetical protein
MTRYLAYLPGELDALNGEVEVLQLRATERLAAALEKVRSRWPK